VNPELFDRRFSLTVGTLEVSDFKCHFRIEKTLKPEPNKALVEIWNLHPEHRALLGELAPGKKIRVGHKKGKTAPKLMGRVPVRLEAGYTGPGTDLIYLGDLRTVDTEISGADWITSISSGDGERAYRTSRINQTFQPKTPVSVALKKVVAALGLGQGNLNQILPTLSLQGGSKLLVGGLVMSGPAVRALTDLCRSADVEWSIQDGVLQFQDLNTALSGEAVYLSPDTGLIGSPSVDSAGVLKCKCLMMPQIRLGRIVVLEAAEIKGQFRVEGLVYEGDTHGDDWTIELTGRRY
jgi:hypothetical protein